MIYDIMRKEIPIMEVKTRLNDEGTQVISGWFGIIKKEMRKYRRKNYDKLIPREKSRKVIYLEKRGPGTLGHSVLSRCFIVFGILCIAYCGGIAVAGFGTYFFIIWGGMGAVFLGIGMLLGNRRLLARLPRWIKKACCILFCLGLLLFCTVEGMILSQYHAQAAPGADYCIVLGAQWKATGPSEVLRRRLDKAIAYLTANPDTRVIVSGGRGGNESIAEAAGMREYLIQAGIDEARIEVEDESSNTYENLVFSGRLLDKEKDRVVIVTNNFHVFRSLGIAKKQGYAQAEGLAASSTMGMEPNNLLREFFGVLKDFFVGNL